MALAKELLDLKYREIRVRLEELFPRFNLLAARKQFIGFADANPHQTILNVAMSLSRGGYEQVLREQGFYDTKYPTFSGHCHQCSPALGLALRSLGFNGVSYLECFRTDEQAFASGRIVMVNPQQEPNPDRRQEFCGIGRIPYCCLEIKIDGEAFHATGKHIESDEKGKPKALLTPNCYTSMTGVFAHQDDPTKSGIYLDALANPDNPGQIIWKKQTAKDPAPELFATYLRMQLV